MIKLDDKIHAGDTLFILVGLEGESACVIDGVETREGLCSQMVRAGVLHREVEIYLENLKHNCRI